MSTRRESLGTPDLPSSHLDVLRWDGESRLTSPWVALEKDTELWSEEGDTSIYFSAYKEGHQRPSLRVTYEIVRHTSLALTARDQDAEQSEVAELWMLYSGRPTSSTRPTKRNIYIPAPADLDELEAFEWHITTRNYFAFCYGRPMVGRTLSGALMELHDRIRFWEPRRSDIGQDVIRYADTIGYMNFAHCQDYALALVQYAERFRLEDIWLEAFSHCVGMSSMLSVSREFTVLPDSTHHLIMETASTMKQSIQRDTHAVITFLDLELSPTHLGITTVARNHLERFRSFLRYYYSQRYGKWPPTTVFTQTLARSMKIDFQHLYDYLVDRESKSHVLSQKPVSGGICVPQNIQTFDRQHSFSPLPHPSPLIPELPLTLSRSYSARSFSSMRPVSSQTSNITTRGFQKVLVAASNGPSLNIMSIPIIKAFSEFENTALHERPEKLTIADARKIEWLLVYCTLQTLFSITDAPEQVKDSTTPTYALCWKASNVAPWKHGRTSNLGHSVLSSGSVSSRSLQPENTANALNNIPSSPQIDVAITPDCEADNYLKHVDISTTTWRDRLATREPSAMALDQLARQTRTGPHNPRHARSKTSVSALNSRHAPALSRSKTAKRAVGKNVSVDASSIATSRSSSDRPMTTRTGSITGGSSGSSVPSKAPSTRSLASSKGSMKVKFSTENQVYSPEGSASLSVQAVAEHVDDSCTSAKSMTAPNAPADRNLNGESSTSTRFPFNRPWKAGSTLRVLSKARRRLTMESSDKSEI